MAISVVLLHLPTLCWAIFLSRFTVFPSFSIQFALFVCCLIHFILLLFACFFFINSQIIFFPSFFSLSLSVSIVLHYLIPVFVTSVIAKRGWIKCENGYFKSNDKRICVCCFYMFVHRSDKIQCKWWLATELIEFRLSTYSSFVFFSLFHWMLLFFFQFQFTLLLLVFARHREKESHYSIFVCLCLLGYLVQCTHNLLNFRNYNDNFIIILC